MGPNGHPDASFPFRYYAGIAMIRETAIAAAFLGFFGGGIAQAAYTVCRSQLDGREYLICAPESCFPGDRSVGYNPGKHPSCQSSRTQQDCGNSLDEVEEHRRRNRKSMPFRMRTGREVRYKHQTCRRSSSSAGKIQVSVLASAALLKGLAFSAASRADCKLWS